MRGKQHAQNEQPTQEQLEAMTEKVAGFDKKEMTNTSAITLYEDVLQEMVERTTSFYLEQGMSLYTNKKYENALPFFESAYQYAPNDPEIIYHLARIYHNLNDLEQAKELYNEALNNGLTRNTYIEKRLQGDKDQIFKIKKYLAASWMK